MMNLLEIPDNAGYPTEYLLARLRGRSAHFIKEWDGPLFSHDPVEYLRATRYGEFISEYSGDGAWKHLLREFKWVYLQMNNELREAFYPFFMFTEIKTLIVCFRYKTAKEISTDTDKLLTLSLLSGETKKILDMKSELPDLLNALENKLLSLSGKPSELEEAFFYDGLKGLEQRLTILFIGKIINSGLHPVLRNFFASLIDLKNITAIYKHIRWGVKTNPYLIPGGNLTESRLKKVFQTYEISGIGKLLHNVTGSVVEEETGMHIERTLYAGLLKQTKTMQRVSLDIGLVLHYLWRCYIEALNLSIILYGSDIDRNVLKEELVIG
jgi:vacuolar-type H+-ATPase subunit C/Vma6